MGESEVGQRHPARSAKSRFDESSQKNRGRRNTPRAKRTVPHECAGFRAEPHGLFLPKQKALERHARQLLFWNFFLFGKEKSAAFPLSKEFWSSFAEKRSKINKNLNVINRTINSCLYVCLSLRLAADSRIGGNPPPSSEGGKRGSL